MIHWRDGLCIALGWLAVASLLVASPPAFGQPEAAVCGACADKQRALAASEAALKAIEAQTAGQSSKSTHPMQQVKAPEPRLKTAQDAAQAAKAALEACIRERCGARPVAPGGYPFDAHPVVAMCPDCREQAETANQALQEWLDFNVGLASIRLRILEVGDWLAKHAGEAKSQEYAQQQELLDLKQVDLGEAEDAAAVAEKNYREELASLARCEEVQCTDPGATPQSADPPFEPGPIPTAKCPPCEIAVLKLRADLANLHRTEFQMKLVAAKLRQINTDFVGGNKTATAAEQKQIEELKNQLNGYGQSLAAQRQLVDSDRAALETCNQHCTQIGIAGENGGAAGESVLQAPAIAPAQVLEPALPSHEIFAPGASGGVVTPPNAPGTQEGPVEPGATPGGTGMLPGKAEGAQICVGTYCRFCDGGTCIGLQIEVVNNVAGNNPFDPVNPLGVITAGRPTQPPGPSPPGPPPPPGPPGPPPPETGCATNFSNGSYLCSGSCGIASTGLTVVSGNPTMTANPFGANSNVLFSCSGASATSQSKNLTILGAPGHGCTLQAGSLNSFSGICQNASGGSCTMSCSR